MLMPGVAGHFLGVFRTDFAYQMCAAESNEMC